MCLWSLFCVVHIKFFSRHEATYSTIIKKKVGNMFTFENEESKPSCTPFQTPLTHVLPRCWQFSSRCTTTSCGRRTVRMLCSVRLCLMLPHGLPCRSTGNVETPREWARGCLFFFRCCGNVSSEQSDAVVTW